METITSSQAAHPASTIRRISRVIVAGLVVFVVLAAIPGCSSHSGTVVAPTNVDSQKIGMDFGRAMEAAHDERSRQPNAQ